MSASMAVLAGTNYALTNQNNQNAGYTQAAFLFIFNTFFAIGWLGMTWLYPAEIVYVSLIFLLFLKMLIECSPDHFAFVLQPTPYRRRRIGSSISWS